MGWDLPLRLRSHRADPKTHSIVVPGRNVNLGEMDRILKKEFGRRGDYHVIIQNDRCTVYTARPLDQSVFTTLCY
ncbi:hypothetical protein PG987_009199 [Apiospora arundinis]